MALVLKEPRKKGYSNQKTGNPLPVLVESVTGIPAHLAIWRSFSGRFNGDCVEVSDPEDMSTLYGMGFFGKGSLSRGYPRSARSSQDTEIIRERQWKRRCEWSQQRKESGLTEPIKTEDDSTEFSSQEKGREVVVIADTDTEGEDFLIQLKPRQETFCGPSLENLSLLLEEALFLNYALGCFYIFDIHGQKVLSCQEFWALCLESDPCFIQRYVSYHYFRSKGWVVKSGLKFGGDYLLYKDGPGIYHASYVVLTKVIFGKNAIDTGELSEKPLDWVTLMGLNRLTETSGKEVLLCYVIWPEGVLPGSDSSPEVIKKFKVHEVLLRRWQSSVERIDKKLEQEENNDL